MTDRYFDGHPPIIERIHMDYNLTDQAYTFHLHTGVTELVYVESGSGIYMINRQHFHVSAGDLIVIEGGNIHSGASSLYSPMRTLVIVVSDVRWMTGENRENIILPQSYPLIKSGSATHWIGASMLEIWRMMSSETMQADTDLSSIMLAPVLVTLRRYYMDRKPYMTIRRNEMAEDILSYIYVNYSQRITLDVLSSLFHLSAGHINRVFQNEYQISPINYLIDVRFSKAKAFLINTDMPVSDIANAVGYTNTAHFTKLFLKRIGYSPIDYRMLHRDDIS